MNKSKQKKKHANFFSRQNYESGKNILLNRFAHLNGKIEKSWLELSLDSFKVKCKQLFLQTTSKSKQQKTSLLGTKQAPYDYCQAMSH